jgi:ABC-type glycerol-3-phosphate transport system permease component
MTTAVAGRPRKKQYGKGSLTLATWVVAILFVFPLLWMILTAFKQEADAYTDPPKLLFSPTFDQISNVLNGGFLPYVSNSAFVTILSTILVLLFGVPAAYALSLAPVKGTSNALGFFLSTKMLPIVAAIIPLYIISQRFFRFADHQGEISMRTTAIIGVLLIILGIVALSFQTFTFFTHERVVDAGPLHVDIQKPHTIVLHPIVGVVALAAGVVLLIAGRRAVD